MANAAMRELADLTSHLRSGSATEQEHPSLADQMWADIAEVLRLGSA
jgi:hypothetical protein